LDRQIDKMSEGRPQIIGPDSGPEPPFPLRMGGKVVSGFGRGSKELGIPTANIPVEGVSWIETAESGVYFGWAGIQLPSSHPDLSSTSSSATTAAVTTGSTPPAPLSLNVIIGIVFAAVVVVLIIFGVAFTKSEVFRKCIAPFRGKDRHVIKPAAMERTNSSAALQRSLDRSLERSTSQNSRHDYGDQDGHVSIAD